MVDHICEPMPSTGSHLPNYAARCKMGERHRLPSTALFGYSAEEALGQSVELIIPDHLPRERIVIAVPESCPCCGSAKLSKLGEDITETLEVIRKRCLSPILQRAA